jgi:hypothetical protein
MAAGGTAAAGPPGFCRAAWAFCGFVLGSALAVADPLIAAARKGDPGGTAGLLLMVAESVSLLVPVCGVAGLVSGAVAWAFSRALARAYRAWLRVLPLVFAMALFAYLLRAYGTETPSGYAGLGVGTSTAVTCALAAAGVALPLYYVLAALVRRLRSGRTRGVIVVVVALGAGLCVPLAGYLAVR